MDSIKNNRFVVGLIAGVTITGLGFYYFYSKGVLKRSSVSKKKIDPYSSTLSQHEKLFLKDKAYLDMIAKLKSPVQSEKLAGTFSKVTLTNINQAILLLFKTEYLSNYQENRNMRRKYISSLVDYAIELFKGSAASGQLMEEATIEVLRDLQIDPAMFNKEFDRVSHDDPNFQLFNIYMLERLKTQIPSRNPSKLNKEKLVEYFKFQLAIYDDFNIQELKDYTPDDMISCKQSYLCDKAATKFGIEEEDIIREPALLNDPDVVELQRELQNKYYTDKQNNISFPY